MVAWLGFEGALWIVAERDAFTCPYRRQTGQVTSFAHGDDSRSEPLPPTRAPSGAGINTWTQNGQVGLRRGIGRLEPAHRRELRRPPSLGGDGLGLRNSM